MSDQSRADSVNRVAVACGVIETVAVCLRLLARYKTKARFAVDDWVIVATLIPSYAMLVLGSFSTSPNKVFRKILTLAVVTAGKGGQHQDTLTRADLVVFLKVTTVISLSSCSFSEADCFLRRLSMPP